MTSLAKPINLLFLLLLALSVGLKLYAAQFLAWEADYVPLIARGQAWLAGGEFPAVGALSSVAAYNMPFLVWMQIPALAITRDARTTLIATQLVFNLVGSLAIYRFGGRLFGAWAGLAAALLFTFSEVGVSGAYTAWAQLLLPVFAALFAYSLYLWLSESRARHVAAAWIIATAAFMTHFSAVLLYAALALVWLPLRLPINRRGLLIGWLVSGLMLAPYLAFDAGEDFANLRAFITQRSRISAEVLAEVADLKPEAAAMAENADGLPSERASPPAPSARLERGITWALSVPAQLVRALRLAFDINLASLQSHAPALHVISVALRLALEACFWLVCFLAFRLLWREWRSDKTEDGRTLARFLVFLQTQIAGSAAGRVLFLLLIALIIAAGLSLARAGPDRQPTYFTSLVSLQCLICAGALALLEGRARWQKLMLLLVFVHVGLGGLDRVLRVARHDFAEYTPLNTHLYAHVEAAVDWIARDWTGEREIAISYDFFPEMAPQWWVVAWHSVDPAYRIGGAYDFLLAFRHGIANRNRNPQGLAAGADYVVTTEPGLARYDPPEHRTRAFGPLRVVKPLAE